MSLNKLTWLGSLPLFSKSILFSIAKFKVNELSGTELLSSTRLAKLVFEAGMTVDVETETVATQRIRSTAMAAWRGPHNNIAANAGNRSRLGYLFEVEGKYEQV